MIIATGKIYSNRIFIPKEIREKFDMRDKDTIIWEIENDKIVLTIQEKPKKVNKRYNVYETPH